MTLARGDALRRGAGEIAVIGGGEIFAALMPLRPTGWKSPMVARKPRGRCAFSADRSCASGARSPARPGTPDPADTAPVTYVTYRREKAASPQ